MPSRNTSAPQKLLEHPEHRGALLIGQDVEHRAAFLGTEHRKFDRARAAQPVDRHRRRARDAELSHLFHSGFHASTASISMKVANASFSQMPFHQRIVTRSPNHMCAFSCETTSATRSSSARDADFLIRQQRGLAKCDRAEVLHRARGEIGNRDQIELVAGIFEPVIVGEIFERIRSDLLGPLVSPALPGTWTTRNGVPASTGAVASNSPTINATR